MARPHGDCPAVELDGALPLVPVRACMECDHHQECWPSQDTVVNPETMRGLLLDAFETSSYDPQATQHAIMQAIGLLGDEHVEWANNMLDEANNPQQAKDEDPHRMFMLRCPQPSCGKIFSIEHETMGTITCPYCGAYVEG